MGNPCVSHSITEPQIDDNYELLCRLWSPVVGAEEGGLSTVVARGFQRVKIYLEELLKGTRILFQFLFLMQKSILYAKIALSQKKIFPKFSFKHYIGLLFS